MNITIIGLNYSPEKVGVAVYTSGMAEYLGEKGHHVTVIAGKPYYPNWKVEADFRGSLFYCKKQSRLSVIWLPHYVPATPTGFKRIIHYFSFALSALIPTLALSFKKKPDVVIAIAPSLISGPVALFVGTLFRSKTWLHVQDLEVDAAIATGYFGSSYFTGLAYKFEQSVVSRFTRVSSISKAMCEHLQKKGVPNAKLVHFRNWSNTDLIRPLENQSIFRRKWKIDERYILLYSGNIARKQGLEVIIQTAKLLVNRQDILFIICGDGPSKPALLESANGLKNVRFFELQPPSLLNELLGLATVHLLPQLSEAADLVLPSKLANMLASGRPIIATALPGTSLAEEIEDCGFVVPPADPIQLKLAILQIITNEEMYRTMSRNARIRAERQWSKSAVLDSFALSLSDCLHE